MMTTVTLKEELAAFMIAHPTTDADTIIKTVRELHVEQAARLKASLDAKRKALAEEYKAAGLPMRTRKAKGAA